MQPRSTEEELDVAEDRATGEDEKLVAEDDTADRPPERKEPPIDWKHFDLYKAVRESLYVLPSYFKAETFIEGISATDLYTLNDVLGATIEAQVVATLNRMRTVWDPDENYRQFSFVRQPQTFPDVLLRKSSKVGGDGEIILGIELKGWYLLAKEKEPSFRYSVTPKACNPWDLLVVVPWVLDNVISGSPTVFTPWVEQALYAAEYKNYYWRYLRKTTLDRSIESPDHVTPYPSKSDNIVDSAKKDSGGNFGRLARTGIMDDYIGQIQQEPLCGINAEYWLRFFKVFSEEKTHESILKDIERLAKQVKVASTEQGENVRVALAMIQSGLSRLIGIESES